MVRKLLLTVSACVILAGAGYAQRTSLGYDYLRMGEYESAEKYFMQIPDSAESNFFLGEIAFARGEFSKALNFYNAGIAAGDVNYMNEIGLAKLQLRENAKAGEAALRSILKRDKKNVELIINIGYAFLGNNMYDKALEMVTAAQKIDLNNPLIYILNGDILNATNDNPGLAAASYESAISFDETFSLAYIKYANVYSQVDPVFAARRLEALLKINPDYLIAYRDLGIIYRNIGQYPKAVFALKTYFDAGIYTFKDISEYGFALYFANDYENALIWLNKGLEINPDDFVLNRLRMYIAARTGDYENGIVYAERFFSLDKAGRTYLPSDHIEYAAILGGLGRYAEALAQFDKASELVTDNQARVELYTDMIKFATGTLKDNGLAAEIYQRIMDIKGDETDVLDYTMLGVYYYNAIHSKTDAQRQVILNRRSDSDFVSRLAAFSGVSASSFDSNDELFISSAVNYYVNRANVTFDRVIELAPTSYLGYLYKGRIASILDPEMKEGAAKSYYEGVVNAVTETGDDSRQAINATIEAYRYLGVLSYQRGDMNTALDFMNRILAIEPNNEYAQGIIEHIKEYQRSL